jgi:hypothetical protein
MTAFGFGGSPVPSIKVAPTNTDIVSLFIVSTDNDDNDELFCEMEGEAIIVLDS